MAGDGAGARPDGRRDAGGKLKLAARQASPTLTAEVHGVRMTSESSTARQLKSHLRTYDYPCVVWDPAANGEVQFASMRQVEKIIRDQLRSGQPASVRDGLANVVFWGFRSQGICRARLRDFLCRVSEGALANAARVLPQVQGPALRQLKDLGLPQFSCVPFLSKLRMFLDPTEWVVLDNRLARIGSLSTHSILRGISRYGTTIPCTRANEVVYAAWCSLCRMWGDRIGAPAVDVERAVFQAAAANAQSAARLLGDMERLGS